MISSLAWGAAFEPGSPIPELHLANGTVLRDVKIVSTGSTTVMATWAGGKGTIALSQLPEELRSRLAHEAALQTPARPSAVVSPANAPALDAHGQPTSITLNNGFVMQTCEIVRWNVDSIVVRYPGGTVPVRFADIHPAQRAWFESNRAAALKQQREDDAANAVQVAERNKQQAKTEFHDFMGKVQTDTIAEGIRTHQAVGGMTMDEAREAMGEPNSTSESTEGTVVLTDWVYAPTASHKWGRRLHFENGKLKHSDN